MDLNDKISRASLHIEVADRVREMIFDSSLQPGERIDELDLSAKLGTSRTPLREALKVLANEGLVRLVPGRGAFVTELEPLDVDSLFPVLALLEGRCAAEAVRSPTVSRCEGEQGRGRPAGLCRKRSAVSSGVMGSSGMGGGEIADRYPVECAVREQVVCALTAAVRVRWPSAGRVRQIVEEVVDDGSEAVLRVAASLGDLFV